MKYRSRMEITADILELALNGERKTRLMYRASLSHPQLTVYLELLISGGLLKYVEERKLYQTTEKGRHFLEISKEMNSMLPPQNKPPGEETIT